MTPFAATWTHLEIIILSEVSNAEKDKYHTRALIHGVEIWHKWSRLQNRKRLADIEDKLVLVEGEGAEEGLDANYSVQGG